MTRPLVRSIGVLLLCLLCVARAEAQSNITRRVDVALKAAGVPILGVSISDPANKATWKVNPSTLQAQAQPIIDAFDPTDPVYANAEADARTDVAFVGILDDVLTALLEQWPAMHAEAAAGTLKGNLTLYKQRIRQRVRLLHRAKATP